MLRRLLSGTFIRNILILSSGTALAQVIIFLSSLVLTRVYNVEDFGYFQYYQTALLFLLIVSCLRYDFAIMAAENEKETLELGFLSLTVIIIFFLLLSLGLYIFKNSLIDTQLVPLGMVNYLWIFPIAFFLGAVYQVLNYMLVRFSNFQLISITKISQSVGLSSAQMSIGIALKGPIGLFIGDVIGRIFGIFTILKWLLKRHSALIKELRISQLKRVALKFKYYPIYSMPGTIFNSLGSYLPTFFLAYYYDYTVLGYYSLADKVFLIPFVLIGQSMGQIYTNKIRELNENDRSGINRLFKNIISKTGMLIIGPLIIFAIYAPDFFSFVFGENWRLAGTYASLLVFMQFFGFLAGVTSFTLFILGKQKIQFFWELSRVLAVLGLFIFSRYKGLTPIAIILSYSIIMGVFYIIQLYLIYITTKKINK